MVCVSIFKIKKKKTCKYEKFCIEACCVASYNEHVKPLGKKEMNVKTWLLNVNNVSVMSLLTEYQSQ